MNNLILISIWAFVIGLGLVFLLFIIEGIKHMITEIICYIKNKMYIVPFIMSIFLTGFIMFMFGLILELVKCII